MGFDFDECSNFYGGSMYHGLSDVELEHVEIYFKPKAKYFQAFDLLQKLQGLTIATRAKRNEALNNFDNGFNDCRISVDSECLYNAIDIKTGELDLEYYLNELGGADIVKKSDIKFYVQDEKLQEKLLKARKKIKNAYEKSDVLISLGVMLMPDYEQQALKNYVMRDGIVKIVVNTMEFSKEANSVGLGKLLATMAEEIVDVVYVDSRAIKDKSAGLASPAIKYKQLKYACSDAELRIYGLRVPEDGTYLNYIGHDTTGIMYEEKDISIPLYNMDNVVEVHVSMHVDEAKQDIIREVFAVINAVKGAIENHQLFDLIDEKNSAHTCIINALLNGEWNLRDNIIRNNNVIGYLAYSNRPYEIRGALEGILEDDVIELICKSKGPFDTDFEFERFMAECTASQMLDRASGEVVNCYNEDKGTYNFSGQFFCVDEKELLDLFMLIKKHVAGNDEHAVMDIHTV